MSDVASHAVFAAYERWRHDRAPHDLEAVVTAFVPDIHDLAAELAPGLPPNYELSDLLDAGVVGLLEALGDPGFAPGDAEELVLACLNEVEVAIQEEAARIAGPPGRPKHSALPPPHTTPPAPPAP